MLVPLIAAVPVADVSGPAADCKMCTRISGIFRLLTVNGDSR